MSRRDNGPEVLPPAAEARKRVEEHLDSLPSWHPEKRREDLPLEPKRPS